MLPGRRIAKELFADLRVEVLVLQIVKDLFADMHVENNCKEGLLCCVERGVALLLERVELRANTAWSCFVAVGGER